MDKKTAAAAFRATVPVMTGYLVLGIGFGVLLKSKGYGVGWALVMSVFLYAGSMQYLAVELLAGGASVLTAALTTLMVNARHVLYGLSMLERYRDAGAKKPYLIFALTDETYSLVCKDPLPAGVNAKGYYFAVSLLNQIYWVVGCMAGAALGSFLPFDVTGIDFALTALFLTVFLEQWLSQKDHAPALIGVGASLVCLLVFESSNFLLPAMAAITLLLTARRKWAKGARGHD